MVQTRQIIMNILLLSWKDIDHPKAGGAELYIHEIAIRFVKDGHDVTFITSAFDGGNAKAEIDGVNVIRVRGGRFLHNFSVLYYYLKNLRNKFDVVIEAVNTAPYFVTLFGKEKHRFQLYHQLAREVWMYETPGLLGYVGRYILEPVSLWMQSLSKAGILTVSESSKKDLIRAGFSENRISILSEGSKTVGLESLDLSLPKYGDFTVLYMGNMRSMKRPEEIIRGFKMFVEKLPTAKLIVAGGGTSKRFEFLKQLVVELDIQKSVTFIEKPSDEERDELYQRSHVVSMTSVREGWGIIIIEAGRFGTPAVVYDIEGLRDAVIDGETGYVVGNERHLELADAYEKLALDSGSYNRISAKAFEYNKGITFDKAYSQLKGLLDKG